MVNVYLAVHHGYQTRDDRQKSNDDNCLECLQLPTKDAVTKSKNHVCIYELMLKQLMMYCISHLICMLIKKIIK